MVVEMTPCPNKLPRKAQACRSFLMNGNEWQRVQHLFSVSVALKTLFMLALMVWVFISEGLCLLLSS
jgi:hypothetical protein